MTKKQKCGTDYVWKRDDLMIPSVRGHKNIYDYEKYTTGLL